MASKPASGLLLLDKPAGVTSTRAMVMARRALAASKAGHTGTLDPFATGLLPLVFGEATKFSRFLIDSTKAYDATLVLGAETPTGDIETAPVPTGASLPSLAQIHAVATSFVGDSLQIPPMHSAVHVDGRRLYEYARAGLEVERQPRAVRITAIEVRRFEGNLLELSVACSKGTYLRVLAVDIGRALGCGAYLSALRRTAVGPFAVSAAATLETLDAEGAERARERLLPPEALVGALPRVDVDEAGGTRFGHGQAIPAPGIVAGGVFAVFAPAGRFLGVGEAGTAGLQPLRLVAETGEIP